MVTTSIFVDTNARYSVLAWEPVDGSGERLNVGVLTEYGGRCITKPLIRADVLEAMYGASGQGVMKMIASSLSIAEKIADEHGWEAALATVPLASFVFQPTRTTHATSEFDLFRQIVLMHCSLSVLAEGSIASADDLPTPEKEVNQQWTTRVRDAVISTRPELVIYFNREAVLVDGGLPVRFGMLTPKLAAQFGLLTATRQNNGMKDARAKMWELSLAKERNSQLTAALVFGFPGEDDITLTDKQRDQIKANKTELEQETTHKNIELCKVYTVDEAAHSVIQMA